MRSAGNTLKAWLVAAAVTTAAAVFGSGQQAVSEDTTAPIRIPVDSTLTESLVAANIDARDSERLRLYGQFVGSWDIDVALPAIAGPEGRRTGEWIFGWVLDGTAIQDVWRLHAKDNLPGRSGSTVRFPLADGSWRIVWISPASGAVDVMTAYKAENEIVQSGRDTDGTEFRWVFHDISKNAFRWRAESRAPDGRWTLDQQMTAARRSGS